MIVSSLLNKSILNCKKTRVTRSQKIENGHVRSMFHVTQKTKSTSPFVAIFIHFFVLLLSRIEFQRAWITNSFTVNLETESIVFILFRQNEAIFKLTSRRSSAYFNVQHYVSQQYFLYLLLFSRVKQHSQHFCFLKNINEN